MVRVGERKVKNSVEVSSSKGGRAASKVAAPAAKLPRCGGKVGATAPCPLLLTRKQGRKKERKGRAVVLAGAPATVGNRTPPAMATV